MSYWLNAVDDHSLHSPFLFKLYRAVFKKDEILPIFSAVEERRAQLLTSKRLISSPDPGAGSLLLKKANRTVGQIAKHSLSSPRFCRMLYRLAKHHQPRHMLEVGSCFGISSSYLHLAAPEAWFTTIEGNGEIAAIAKETFTRLKQSSIDLRADAAQDVLPEVLKSVPLLDFVFLDAHHTEEATLDFFDRLLPGMGNDSVLVIGDIHWSPEMEQAWKKICRHPAVSLTLDVYQAGIVFFNKNLRKETEVLMV